MCLFPSRAHQEITASVRNPGGGEIFPFRHYPRRNCTQASPPPPLCPVNPPLQETQTNPLEGGRGHVKSRDCTGVGKGWSRADALLHSPGSGGRGEIVGRGRRERVVQARVQGGWRRRAVVVQAEMGWVVQAEEGCLCKQEGVVVRAGVGRGALAGRRHGGGQERGDEGERRGPTRADWEGGQECRQERENRVHVQVGGGGGGCLQGGVAAQAGMRVGGSSAVMYGG